MELSKKFELAEKLYKDSKSLDGVVVTLRDCVGVVERALTGTKEEVFVALLILETE